MNLPSKRALAFGAAGIAATGAAATVGAVLVAGTLWNRLRMADLRGNVALVTGGSRGLGFAVAQELVAQGCNLAICARDTEELEWAKRELEEAGAEVLAIQCDVGVQEEVETMVKRVTEHFGRIDVLVNNAGIISVGPIESQKIGDFRKAMDVMYWAGVYTTLAVLPQMLARRSGRIANVTSIGGKIPVPHLAPYCAAKFAAVGFSETMGAELAKDNIDVTTIVPGLMRTGSHVNAEFKGGHRAEYGWFSLGASSPLTAISARRAARSIVRAIRRGQKEMILSIPAKVATWIHGVMPGTSIAVAGLSNRVMPGTGNSNPQRQFGKECESTLTRSFLTKLGRDAGERLHLYPERRHASGD
jgi:short-subunit dehydrogenase